MSSEINRLRNLNKDKGEIVRRAYGKVVDHANINLKDAEESKT